jgi:hypothetical protein
VSLTDDPEPVVLQEVGDRGHESRMIVGDETTERSSGHWMGSERGGR